MEKYVIVSSSVMNGIINDIFVHGVFDDYNCMLKFFIAHFTATANNYKSIAVIRYLDESHAVVDLDVPVHHMTVMYIYQKIKVI